MEFLKKHYEKILLSVVLLGLGAAAYWMNDSIAEAKADIEKRTQMPAKGKLVQPVDLTNEVATLDKASNPPQVEISGAHNLFNPVTWKRKPDGTLMKVLKEGPAAATITNIAPLYTTITFERAAGSGYYMSIQQLSARRPQEYAKLKEKTKAGLFTITEVVGPAEDPTELVLDTPLSATPVRVSKGHPFQAVDGHIADLRYEPDSKSFNKVRVNDTITFSGERYKVIDITNNAVRVISISTEQKTTIMWNKTPQ